MAATVYPGGNCGATIATVSTRTCNSGHRTYSTGQIYFANYLVAIICNKYISGGIGCHACGLIETRSGCGTTIAGKASGTSTRVPEHDTRGAYSTNNMVIRVAEKYVACSIGNNTERCRNSSSGCHATVTAIAGASVARNRNYGTRNKYPDSFIALISKKKVPSPVVYACNMPQIGCRGRSPVAGKSGCTCATNG
jgi:hypothetical protein